MEHGYIFNPFGKTKAAKRKIPLAAAALAIIKRRTQEAKGAYVFPHRLSQLCIGHSKLNMVMRYAHPQAHQADAVKRLELFNAAKEIAEAEREKNRRSAALFRI